MTPPANDSLTPGYALGFADPIGVLRAARLAAVEHPRWCDQARCAARVGGGRHVGHPVRWRALGDDVEFTLSKLQHDGGPAGYLLGTRRTSEVEVFETELLEGDFEAALTARMRVQLAAQEIEGDPRDDVVPDIADTAELPVVEAQVTASADHG